MSKTSLSFYVNNTFSLRVCRRLQNWQDSPVAFRRCLRTWGFQNTAMGSHLGSFLPTCGFHLVFLAEFQCVVGIGTAKPSISFQEGLVEGGLPEPEGQAVAVQLAATEIVRTLNTQSKWLAGWETDIVCKFYVVAYRIHLKQFQFL